MTPPPTLQTLIDTVRADAPGPEALVQLGQAVHTVSELEQVGESLLGHFVEQCRLAGHSWSEIATALGVSKQAAHKRFSYGADMPPAFDRLTLRARAVLGAAAEEARRLGHGSVGPEELLLSLFAPAGAVAAQVLAELGIARAEVERQLREAGGGPASPGAPDGEAEPGVRPYTPAAVDLLRGSVEEALRLGHNYVGTEHLLLALARHSESAASRVLIALGGSHDAVREKTLSALAEHRKS